jgi:glycosyltransferase involved in cell wall biosynthesis
LLVSVIINSFNYAQYIEEAIDSVLSQDFALDQMEILVVDDGSTDDTEIRVRKYGSRVKYLYKPNGGQASALNLGFDNAQGQIIALLDADDFWLPNKIKRVVREFQANPKVGMVYHRLVELDSDSGVRSDASFSAISGVVCQNRRDLLCYMLYPTSALAFRRNVLVPLLPIPNALTIQADAFLAGLIIFLAPVAAVNEVLAVYRIHGKNLFHLPNRTTNPDVIRRRVETRKVLIDSINARLQIRDDALSKPMVGTWLTRLNLMQETDEFSLSAPNRLRLFRHLYQENRCYMQRLSFRHILFNYARTFASLILGYETLEKFDQRHRKAQLAVK